MQFPAMRGESWAGKTGPMALKEMYSVRTQQRNSADVKLSNWILQMVRFQYGKLVLVGRNYTVTEHVTQTHFSQLRLLETVSTEWLVHSVLWNLPPPPDNWKNNFWLWKPSPVPFGCHSASSYAKATLVAVSTLSSVWMVLENGAIKADRVRESSSNTVINLTFLGEGFCCCWCHLFPCFPPASVHPWVSKSHKQGMLADCLLSSVPVKPQQSQPRGEEGEEEKIGKLIFSTECCWGEGHRAQIL